MPAKIEKRGADTYLLTVADGYDSHGKQLFKRKRIRASSERAARREYEIFAAEVRNHRVAFTGKCKLTEFARQWFREYCVKELAPKTQRSYKNQLERRILPALGHIDIKNLMPQHIVKFLNELRENGTRFDCREGRISEESIRYCFRVLSSMLQDAVQWQVITSNPCERVKPPSSNHARVRIMDEASLDRMFSVLAEEPFKYQVIVMLAIDSGLRLGELVGLKWADIEMSRGILHVTKSNQAMHGKGIFTKSPKNETSMRDVALSDYCIELLQKHRAQQMEMRSQLGEKWEDGDWIFTQWNGLPIYPTTPSAWFRKFLKRHGLPHMPFHALRHLSATILISKGVPLKNVSARLGHADIRTTANIYGEALQSVDRQAADKMDEFLQRKKSR